MNPPPDDDDDDVGHGRAPKRTRWKKGQSGNQGRRYPKRSRSGAEMFARLLMKPVAITVGGKTKRVPTMEAIFLQLLTKEVSGDLRALSIRLKYQQFAQQHSKTLPQIAFVDNDYSEALAAKPLKKDDVHE
jgi:hypothetical protein